MLVLFLEKALTKRRGDNEMEQLAFINVILSILVLCTTIVYFRVVKQNNKKDDE